MAAIFIKNLFFSEKNIIFCKKVKKSSFSSIYYASIKSPWFGSKEVLFCVFLTKLYFFLEIFSKKARALVKSSHKKYLCSPSFQKKRKNHHFFSNSWFSKNAAFECLQGNNCFGFKIIGAYSEYKLLIIYRTFYNLYKVQ